MLFEGHIETTSKQINLCHKSTFVIGWFRHLHLRAVQVYGGQTAPTQPTEYYSFNAHRLLCQGLNWIDETNSRRGIPHGKPLSSARVSTAPDASR